MTRKKKSEVWDASHFALAATWHSCWQLFPPRMLLRSRPVKVPHDVAEVSAAYGQEPVVFFSAWLSCGHVVRAPLGFVLKPPDAPGKKSRRRPFVPCYKCWAQMGGRVAGLVCSFCGVPHEPAIPCMRPHEG